MDSLICMGIAAANVALALKAGPAVAWVNWSVAVFAFGVGIVVAI